MSGGRHVSIRKELRGAAVAHLHHFACRCIGMEEDIKVVHLRPAVRPCRGSASLPA
jgi:hypothetical protein